MAALLRLSHQHRSSGEHKWSVCSNRGAVGGCGRDDEGTSDVPISPPSKGRGTAWSPEPTGPGHHDLARKEPPFFLPGATAVQTQQRSEGEGPR